VIRSLEGRAQVAVVALWLTVVASIADAYAHAHRLRLVQDAVEQQLPGVRLALPRDAVEHANDYVDIALVVSTVLLVVAAVAWLVFQVAAHRRLAPALSGWRASPRAGVVAWLVPVGNLVAPVLLVSGLLGAARARSVLLLAAWWASWLGSAVLTGIGTENPDVLADQRTIDALAIGGDALGVAAAVLAIGIVRRLLDGAEEAAATA